MYESLLGGVTPRATSADEELLYGRLAPDVVDETRNSIDAEVSISGRRIGCGQWFTPAAVRTGFEIRLLPRGRESGAGAGAGGGAGGAGGAGGGGADEDLFTVVCVDPDTPCGSREIVHLLAVNVRAEARTWTDGCELVVSYEPPSPPATTGLHRYCIFVFRQPRRFTAGAWKTEFSSTKFRLRRWARAHSLGQPVFSTFFVSDYDGSFGLCCLSCLLCRCCCTAPSDVFADRPRLTDD